jgi:hypothetical protein
VSKGQQKCFGFFQRDYLSTFDENKDLNGFFKKTVALLIIWKTIEKEIKSRIRAGIYQSFAQNITAYTLAMFSHKNSEFDLYEYIWEKQELDSDFLDYLMGLADRAHSHLVTLPPGINLVPEHAKKEECWKSFVKKAGRFSKIHNLTKLNMEKQYSGFTKQSRNRASEVNFDVAFCMEIKSTSWRGLAYQIGFRRPHHQQAGKEKSQCENMATTLDQGKIPSDSLAASCKAIFEKCKHEGWVF